MFGKKKEAAPVTAAEPQAAENASAKKKKKDEMLSSTIQETVTETVIDNAFSKNDDFITVQDGRTYYVGLFCTADQIGGLSKKDAKKRHSDAGEIIEAISSGRMAVLATDELLGINALIFVPNRPTLEAMSEYSCLHVDYKVAYVDKDGNVDVKEATMTLEQAASILDGNASLSDFTGDEPVAMGEEADEVPEEAVSDISEDAEASDMDEPPVDTDAETSENADEDDDAMPFEPADDADDYGMDDDDMDDDANWSGDGDMDEEIVEDEEEEEIPKELYQQTISRQLFSDDLDLEVTTDLFDQNFLHNNEIICFSENRGTGWLDMQLSNMAREANAELRTVHQANLTRMRSRYYQLVDQFAIDLARNMDYNDPDTDAGRAYAALCEKHQDELAHVGDAIERQRQELERAWNAELDAAGEDAAQTARRAYRNRHEQAHKEAVRSIEDRVKAALEETHAEQLRTYMTERRKTAHVRMEIGVSEIMKSVAVEYEDVLQVEKALYDEKYNELQTFLDDNRKNDVARTEALAKELAQSDKADAVMAEYTAKIQNLKADFDARKASLANELEQCRRSSAQALADKDKQAVEDNRKAKAREQVLEERISALMDQMASMDERKNKEVQQRIDDLIGEREAMSQKYEHLSDMVKASRKQMVAMATVGVIAAIVVGFVAGQYVNLNTKSAQNQAQIAEDFQDMLDHMKFDLPDGWSAQVGEDGTVTITQDAAE